MSAASSRDLSPQAFVAKWAQSQLSERQGSQEHFLDLCRMLGQPTPAQHDPRGIDYAFEKSISVSGPASAGTKGDRGFVDAWWRGKFAWEYKRKGKHRTLDDAYRQLCQYREALENPPLLIVCDIERIQIHTNFTGTAKAVHEIRLADVGDPRSLDLLRRVFEDPASFKPTVTPEKVTEDVATRFATLAESLRKRGHDPHQAAHFLMRCMFCLFAEDVGLLPRDLFKRTLAQWQDKPERLRPILDDLFRTMARGGAFGPDPVAWFNGGLFDDAPAIELTRDEIGVLLLAATQDWASVEPAIFGTLFERSLDPQKRSQIGAHYTSREDILLVIEPVILEPLRREWELVQASVEKELQRRRAATTKATKAKADKLVAAALLGFAHRLAAVRVLDPACGSGNFLYVAIQKLLELEKEVITFAARPEVSVELLPQVRPSQLHGIEINPYAAELAQVVIWIGYLQWMRDNGFNAPRDPILEPLRNIECRDAILDLSDPKKPKAAEWPRTEFIVGNPPFLGTKMLRGALGSAYVVALHKAFSGRIPAFSDLCCYWFETARSALAAKRASRCGLLATQAIRNAGSREVLTRAIKTGGIFQAWSARPWVLDGASVQIAIVCFDDGSERTRVLDGRPCDQINSDLSAGPDLTMARRLVENEGIAFIGVQCSGPFVIPLHMARTMLGEPNARSLVNLDVVRPTTNGMDLVRRTSANWIVFFRPGTTELAAAAYQVPFSHCATRVVPERRAQHFDGYPYWMTWRPRPAFWEALGTSRRFLASPILTKHRLFSWLHSQVVPDHQIAVFAREDDYFFGVLQCSVHEMWALQKGTQQEDRPRYTPTSTFETFPLPWPPGTEPSEHPLHATISEAAAKLDAMRERWLNPPELIDPIASRIDASDSFQDIPAEARAMIRHSAIMAAAAKDPKLKKRTLTNLYNERPAWLRMAHEALDRAVLAAYAHVDPAGGWSQDWAEVWKETGAGSQLPAGHVLAAQRADIDRRVLENLLRLNQARRAAGRGRTSGGAGDPTRKGKVSAARRGGGQDK